MEIKICDSNGSEKVEKDILQSLLPEGYENMYMVDIGCGTAKVTKLLGFKNCLFIDSQVPEVKPVPFYQGDAIEFLEKIIGINILFALDFIEHLPKDKGQYLLDLIEKRVNNLAVFFTPLGELAMSGAEEEYHPDKHWSGWMPEDFTARGYDVLVFPNYHNPWMDDKVHGAFFAWKYFNKV